jgi:protein phosphatase 1 regulatory subunit 37
LAFGGQTGITYIAQVLKRNRTLKVLNLAENKLDVACLVSLAEALVSGTWPVRGSY